MNENMKKILDVAIAMAEGTETTSVRIGEGCKDLTVKIGEEFVFVKDGQSLKRFVEDVASVVKNVIKRKESLAYSNGYVAGAKAYVNEDKAEDEAEVRTETEQKAA